MLTSSVCSWSFAIMTLTYIGSDWQTKRSTRHRDLCRTSMTREKKVAWGLRQKRKGGEICGTHETYFLYPYDDHTKTWCTQNGGHRPGDEWGWISGKYQDTLGVLLFALATWKNKRQHLMKNIMASAMSTLPPKLKAKSIFRTHWYHVTP